MGVDAVYEDGEEEGLLMRGLLYDSRIVLGVLPRRNDTQVYEIGFAVRI